MDEKNYPFLFKFIFGIVCIFCSLFIGWWALITIPLGIISILFSFFSDDHDTNHSINNLNYRTNDLGNRVKRLENELYDRTKRLEILEDSENLRKRKLVEEYKHRENGFR